MSVSRQWGHFNARSVSRCPLAPHSPLHTTLLIPFEISYRFVTSLGSISSLYHFLSILLQYLSPPTTTKGDAGEDLAYPIGFPDQFAVVVSGEILCGLLTFHHARRQKEIVGNHGQRLIRLWLGKYLNVFSCWLEILAISTSGTYGTYY